MSVSDSFQGMGVMITGGANGIGLAMAEALLAAGARIYIADIDATRIIAESARLSSAGRICKGGHCDVREPSNVAAAIEHAWNELGALDLLCANAGVVKPGPLLSADPAQIQWQFGVNVFGTLNTIRAFVTKLRQARRPGHILITGSETGLSNPQFTRPFQSQVYTMSKHALFGMADVLREELKPDRIGITMLCPGPVATNIAQNSARANPKGPAEGAVDLNVGDAAMSQLMRRMRPASQIAAIALEGLRRGLFVIPTHPHMRDDVNDRYREIMQGFTLVD